jgi:hypothetical protein
MLMPRMIPCAVWTDDCQGKKSFDGPLISISTRFWPGPEGGASLVVDHAPGATRIGELPYGKKPSAHVAIQLNVGPAANGGKAYTWQEIDIEGDTEAQVKAAVEKWVHDRMREIVFLLGGAGEFKAPG